jgi:LuxR family transcriptional regulator, quorum-sensing system regulator BjaR1
MSTRDTFTVIQAIEASESLESVAQGLRAFVRRFGYDRFVLFSSAKNQGEAIDQIFWAEGDWFADGTPVAVETYMRRCPVTRHVFETSEPFFWTKTMIGAEERYQVTRYPSGRGLHGLQIPVFGPTGLEGSVSLGGERIDTTRSATLALDAVGTAALRQAMRLMDDPDPYSDGNLSAREREVLRWSAAGRRQIEIAATLGLSERTIENHLRRIRRKLGARTTAEAVRIALRVGAIRE